MFDKVQNLTGKKYGPVVSCIYCGARDKELTDEHIIAYAIAGTAVLPTASCHDCAKETGRMEQRCCRMMLDSRRYPLKMPSRKGKKRRDKLDITLMTLADEVQKLTLATEDHPAGLILPVFEPPRALFGLPEFVPEKLHFKFWRFGPPDEKVQAIFERLGAKGFAVDIDSLALSRLVAKISHAFAVAEIGLNGFTPILPPLILGQNTNWSHFVGGTEISIPPRTPIEMHSILLEINEPDDARRLVANVRLFSRYGGATYQAIVGSVSREQHERLMADLAARAPKSD
jgi:hypothetical protein